jgi:hypothetical protein
MYKPLAHESRAQWAEYKREERDAPSWQRPANEAQLGESHATAWKVLERSGL